MPTDSITCPEENSISAAIRKFEHLMLAPKVHNVYNVATYIRWESIQHL